MGQVDELAQTLIDPLADKVNIWTSILSWVNSEQFLAACPEVAWILFLE